MNNRTIRFATVAVLLVLALAVAAVPAKADSFNVSLNTSSLSGTQILVFGLVSGGGGVDNTVTLSNFAFSGGSIVPPPNYLGTSGVSGDLGTSISMDDSGSNSTVLFAEEFDPGSSLSFLLTTTNNAAGLTPDSFAMYVCDTGFNCYSDDTNTGAMLILNLTGGTLTPGSFTLNAASAQNLPAPVVTSGATPVPEPSGLLLFAVGIFGLGAYYSRTNRFLGRRRFVSIDRTE
jgi:hypothetical protein